MQHRPPEKSTILQCVGPRLARANAHHLVEIEDEDLTITDSSGLRRIDNRFDNPISEVRGNRNLDLELRKKVNCVVTAAVKFGAPALASVASGLHNGEAVDAKVRERIANIVQFYRLNDCGNEFHRPPQLPVLPEHLLVRDYSPREERPRQSELIRTGVVIGIRLVQGRCHTPTKVNRCLELEVEFEHA
jgi:hypothetical protein